MLYPPITYPILYIGLRLTNTPGNMHSNRLDGNQQRGFARDVLVNSQQLLRFDKILDSMRKGRIGTYGMKNKQSTKNPAWRPSSWKSLPDVAWGIYLVLKFSARVRRDVVSPVLLVVAMERRYFSRESSSSGFGSNAQMVILDRRVEARRR